MNLSTAASGSAADLDISAPFIRWVLATIRDGLRPRVVVLLGLRTLIREKRELSTLLGVPSRGLRCGGRTGSMLSSSTTDHPLPGVPRAAAPPRRHRPLGPRPARNTVGRAAPRPPPAAAAPSHTPVMSEKETAKKNPDAAPALVPPSPAPLVDLVLDGLSSEHSRRAYRRALEEFFGWYPSNASGEGFTRAVVQRYRSHLGERGLSAASTAASAPSRCPPGPRTRPRPLGHRCRDLHRGRAAARLEGRPCRRLSDHPAGGLRDGRLLRRPGRARQDHAARSQAHLRQARPPRPGAARADPDHARPRLRPDHRALPGTPTEPLVALRCRRGQRTAHGRSVTRLLRGFARSGDGSGRRSRATDSRRALRTASSDTSPCSEAA